jgi:phosphoethanolamine N-methyltransferase
MVMAGNNMTDNGARWRAWIWLCPWAMLGLAVAILIVAGVSIWSALLVTMLLVCPAIILWGVIRTGKRGRT